MRRFPKGGKKEGIPAEKKGGVRVAIAMGSENDWPVLCEAAQALDQLEVTWERAVLSAHRTPREMVAYADKAEGRGVQVVIAGAGGAAHLPGMLAALVPLPVIGVPVPLSALGGLDSLLSIVQMPRGVPVACVALGQAWNAGILAAQIVATADDALRKRVHRYKEELRRMVRASAQTINES